MVPTGYHQYHMRFDTDIRDASHINNDSIARFVEFSANLEALIKRAQTADSTAEKLAVFRDLKEFEFWHLTHMQDDLLGALSDVDPQAYVNISPDVKTLSVENPDGTYENYEKDISNELASNT